MAYTTINKPSEYFNTVLYTGNGSTQSITGVNFQPDLVWIKCRSIAHDNFLFDVIRGATKKIVSNTTDAEGTTSGVTSFDSDGFSLGSSDGMNENSGTFTSWNWLANGAGVSNTDGSITSTVSASTTSGFSIVSWTASANADIGHGLGGKPDFIMTKSRTGSPTGWACWHSALSGNDQDKYIYLDTTAAGTSTNYWLGTNGITSTTFGVLQSGNDNNNGSMIAYCFRSIKGFSKFGSYVGNGSSTDGTFVYTGFKPAFVMLKNTTTTGYSWPISDSKRKTFNDGTSAVLWANREYVEDTGYDVNFFSNGFKTNNTSNNFNQSGSTYIYMAFAEQPLVGTNNIPATAR